jgi:hypothetical protein
MSIGLSGRSGQQLNNLFQQLGMDMGKISDEMGEIANPLRALAQTFERSVKAVDQNGAAQARGGVVQGMAARLAFVAVLKEAMEKATRPGPFNAETAINDLWVHLDPVRQISASAASGQDSKIPETAMLKLQKSMAKRSQLFDTLSKIMERYDQSAKSVINNMR